VIEEAKWTLPFGHESVGAFVTQEEAAACARSVMHLNAEWAFYLSDKRGAWEVIRYPRQT
jgi:hypothetical protein